MSNWNVIARRLRLPLIAAPMFLVSGPELVLAQCRAGVLGSFPALNARPASQLAEWLDQLNTSLTDQDAPYAVNLIAHSSNARFDHDLELCVRHRVPVVITSLGSHAHVNEAIHAYGGLTFHDVIHDAHARKAIERGADGIVAVAAGAGGHAGVQSPFALVQEIRNWYEGPLALSGSIANGRSLAAARILGADLAYVGSAFIATHEANAEPEYKQMIVDGHADDIIYTNRLSGIWGNYLRASIERMGLDLDDLDAVAELGLGRPNAEAKVWRDLWGGGQGIGDVRGVVAVSELVARLEAEFRAALTSLAGLAAGEQC